VGPHDDDLTPWQDDDPIVAALSAEGTDAELAGEAEALAAFRATDDLTQWQAGIAALTAAGTEAELAGEAGALAAFRAAVPKRSRRRYVGRLGVGGAAVTTAVILSSGAAAAYTSSFPRPVQNFIAHATNPLGLQVPVKHPAHHANTATTVPVTPAAVPTTSPSGTPSPTHHRVVPKPHHSSAPSSKPHPSPTATPTPITIPTVTPTPTPTPTPTGTGTPSGGSITISVGATSVPVDGTVTAYGQVSNPDGSPVAGEQVWLIERVAGTTGVSQVAAGTTGVDGSVALTTPPLTHSVRLRLVTESKADSASIGVTLQSTIMATVGHDGTTASIRVATTGALAGDSVAIEKRISGAWQLVAANQIDGSGLALFAVDAPTGRPDHYRAVLRHSSAHSGAVTTFLVAAD
jgi:hypothetical protein